VKKIIKFCHTFIVLNFYSFSDKRLRKGLVFGRAFSPLKFSSNFFSFWFGKLNYNNIILQAKGISGEDNIKIARDGTYNFTRYLEKKLLIKIVKIIRLPFSIFSGYITSGGTEANIYAMWVAREWAISKDKKSGAEKTYWIISNNAHYSIRKAIQLLDIDNNSRNEIISVKTDLLGRGSCEKIIEYIKEIRNRGNDPIILPLTVMTTECGSIDPVREINNFITESKFDNIFFHIDAAFSGFFLPFLDEYKDIFSLDSLTSIGLDFSKTLGGPVGAGAIIFRSGLERYASIYAPYLSGNADQTLSGSRKGMDTIAMYGLLSVNDINDLRRESLEALEKTKYLVKEMSTINFIKLFYDPKLNYIVFSLMNTGKEKEEKIRKILRDYSISSSIVKIVCEDRELFKIIIRSNHKYKNIKKLVKSLRLASKI